MSLRLKRLFCCVLAALPLSAIAFDAVTPTAPKLQTRCGWFHNPSPNNASLTDRDGEWAIAIQGQFDAKGDWPEFKKSEWVSSGNASYGHGCACMRVVADPDTHRITSIASSTVKPLATCRRDKALKAPRRTRD
jgi:hypothetical protein